MAGSQQEQQFDELSKVGQAWGAEDWTDTCDGLRWAFNAKEVKNGIVQTAERE